VYFVDLENSGEMVNTGVDTNLVHDGDTSLLCLSIELHHGGRDVRGGDDVLLLADGRLDDGRVERIGDQADDDVNFGDFRIEGLVVVDIELLLLVVYNAINSDVPTLMAVALGMPLANACAFARVLQAARV
jgi:hypothetical protein